MVSKVYVTRPPLASLIDTTRKSTRKAGQMRKAYFGERYGRLDTPTLEIEELGPSPRSGPLLLDTYDTTIVVPPGCEIALTAEESLVINTNG